MKYKFDSVFPELGYIKELLGEFNLPTIPVATDNTKLYDGALYVKDLGIYRYSSLKNKLVKSCEYYFNRPILNLTTKMSITTSYYSTDLHEYLGKYLRFIRDYKHLNLMSLYNCFSNRIIFPEEPTYVETAEGNILQQLDYDKNYNYYALPVRFGQTYTIGIDSSTPIKMWCTLWDGVELSLSGASNNSKLQYSDIINLRESTLVTATSCKFNKPFIYTKLKNFDASKFINYFNSLVLVIKVPVSNKTAISVLEGDYLFNTHIDGKITTDMYHGTLEDNYYDKNFPTKLSLFKVNDNEKHPFADRLVEYLLDEAVTNLDNLDDNIKRVQEYLLYLSHKTPDILYGVWDENMNKSIYDLSKYSYISGYGITPVVKYSNMKTNTIKVHGDSEGTIYNKNLIDLKYDLLMYMDKDVEGYFLATGLDDKYTR